MKRIWKEPSVCILAYTQLSSDGNKDFSSWVASQEIGSLDEIPEVAGRVCYDSFGKGRKTNKEYLGNIIQKEHFSVLEHSVITVGIQGISRACSHELVRHRHFSFSQRSQRYCREVAFVAHPNLSPEQVDWLAMEASHRIIPAYERLQADLPDTKGGQEVARMLLPNYTETKMVVTGNLRTWREFFLKRGTIHADAEIRRLAVAILKLIKPYAPNALQDLEVQDGATIGVVRPQAVDGDGVDSCT